MYQVHFKSLKQLKHFLQFILQTYKSGRSAVPYNQINDFQHAGPYTLLVRAKRQNYNLRTQTN